jgi:23S rRNA pseudouridine2604 synthase
MQKIRVSKLMAERGLCSRREADSFIERGWVYVDGERISVLGTRIFPNQAITLDKRARRAQDRGITVLLNKPVGYVSAQAEKGYPAASSLITEANRVAGDRCKHPIQNAHMKGLAPAGRLDIDSTGLLVLTEDGRIARRLIGQDSAIEKEYLVRVRGILDDSGLALLRHGLSLDGKMLKPARVTWVNPQQLQFILTEGKKRQIRRMCEQVGLQVTALKRVRIGNVRLANLPLGKWRYLRDDEVF